MKNFYAICFAVTMFTMGCGTVKQEDAKVGPTASALGLKVVDGKLPKTSQVEVDWSEVAIEGPFTLHRRKVEELNEEDLSKKLDQTKTRFVDNAVVAGEAYVYNLSVVEATQRRVVATNKILVPGDFTVKGRMVLKDANVPKRIRTLTFEKDAILFTIGENVKLEADEIVSEDGQIVSFPADHFPNRGVNGRSGGEITVRAKKATGVLTVQGLGQNGGQGADGVDGVNGEPGVAGNPGKSHPKNPQDQLNLKALREQCRKFIEQNNFRQVQRRVKCDVKPTNGTDGGSGSNGTPGGVGGAGGDSATVRVEIDQMDTLNLKLIVEPGLPGKGGVGGRAGLGAAGGAAGEIDFLLGCPAAVPGQDGVNGKAGPDGAFGPKGKRINPVVVRQD